MPLSTTEVLDHIQAHTWFPLGTTFRVKLWEYLSDDFLNSVLSAAADNSMTVMNC